MLEFGSLVICTRNVSVRPNVKICSMRYGKTSILLLMGINYSEQYANICYAGWKDESQSLIKGEAEDETDIEKEISEEITELKTASKEALFQPVKIDIQCGETDDTSD